MRRTLWLGAFALAVALASCRREASPTDVFVAGSDQLQDAHCACGTSSFGCREAPLASPCVERIVREHEDSIASWLKCAGRTMHREAECVAASGCSENEVEDCHREPEDVCGSAPEPQIERIQVEVEGSCEDSDDSSGSEDIPAGADSDAGSARPGFACNDGAILPLQALCDGFPDCSDGIDEMAVVGCPMLAQPTGPRDAGVAASAGAGGASSNPATNMCLQASRGLANVPAACLQCVCSAAPVEASNCDAQCWDLIGCVGDNCADFEGGSAEQTTCAIDSCQQFLGGAMQAMQVGPFVREGCATSCMVPRPPEVP